MRFFFLNIATHSPETGSIQMPLRNLIVIL